MNFLNNIPGFPQIESKEKAFKVIKHLVSAFIVLGCIQVVFGFLYNNTVLIILGVVYMLLVLLLHRFKRKIFAILLLVLSLALLVIAVITAFQGNLERSSLAAGILVTYASIRIMQATIVCESK